MGQTTSIVCHDCQVRLWIGQKDYIYTGDKTVMDGLNGFLQAHKIDHNLAFIIDDIDTRCDDYENFTTKEKESDDAKS